MGIEGPARAHVGDDVTERGEDLDVVHQGPVVEESHVGQHDDGQEHAALDRVVQQDELDGLVPFLAEVDAHVAGDPEPPAGHDDQRQAPVGGHESTEPGRRRAPPEMRRGALQVDRHLVVDLFHQIGHRQESTGR